MLLSNPNLTYWTVGSTALVSGDSSNVTTTLFPFVPSTFITTSSFSLSASIEIDFSSGAGTLEAVNASLAF